MSLKLKVKMEVERSLGELDLHFKKLSLYPLGNGNHSRILNRRMTG
jgi:hypothetical protein